MNATRPKTPFEACLRQAHFALRSGRATAAEQSLRALAAQAPADVNCLWLLGAALLDQDRLPESTTALEAALSAAPDFAAARVDLARAYRRAGRLSEAREQVRGVLEKVPHHHLAWLVYGDVLVDLGQYDDARVAFDRARLSDPQRAAIESATAALTADDRKKAEEVFRGILQVDPAHTGALCGLAAVSLAADRSPDAERLLRHALKQSAHLPLAHRGLAPALLALGRLTEARAVTEHLQRLEPRSPQTWITTAGVAIRLLRQEDALSAYEHALELRPTEVGLRMSIGHVQKTLGRRQESEASYHAALKMDPGRAEAYWSLADLKNYTFSEAEIGAMQRLLVSDKRDRPNEAQLNFALGRAFEQRREYSRAFDHYARGNALRQLEQPFDVESFERRSLRIRRYFDRAFFDSHAGSGTPNYAPIFIVGLPRSGSTLVEQILASHSRVEGTMELPNIINIVGQFDDIAPGRDGYPETVSAVPREQLRLLGERYIEETAVLRGSGERFTDKLPNNFSHVGLIQAILPNATIIDARRHPMDACFSTFKQHFAEGQTFSYSLQDLGRYYRSYLSLMEHWDAVLPGKVLQVRYEELVADPETHIRRLLAHCALEFEPACLNFHQTRRAVRTASSEQVRQPIYTSGVGYWRHFEAELAPLALALGDALDRF
jgi:tetratricopeptide (TPR) repeat protein